MQTIDIDRYRQIHGEEAYNKLRKSLSVIEETFSKWEWDEIALSFNGGKDSVVLIELVRYVLRKTCEEDSKKDHVNNESEKKLRAIFFLLKNSFDEVVDFMSTTSKEYNLDVTVVQKSFKEGLFDLTSKFGDKKPLKAIFMGTRSSDPGGTGKDHFSMTDSGWPEVMRVFPILDWEYADIWNFILTFNLPYCSLYNIGYTSIGSTTDTFPNKDLWDATTQTYLPAWKLQDGSKERCGRK